MRVTHRVSIFITGVLAIAMLPFGVLAAITDTAASPSLVLRILQIVWLITSVISFGALLYGFLQMRRSRDDLASHEQSKRIVLFSGIALVISLVLLAVISFFLIRSQAKTPTPPPVSSGTEIETGFGQQTLVANIVQHYPNRDQKDVPRNASVLITFKDELYLASLADAQGMLNTTAISIQQLGADDAPKGTPITAHAQMADDKKTIKIMPDQLMGTDGETSTKYQATIFPTVQNSQRASMLGGTGSYSWIFYVGTTIDTAPPQVVSVFPFSGKETFARNALIQVTFSKAIDPTTVKNSFVQFITATSQTPISGILSVSNNYRTILFTPNEVCGSNSCNQRVYCLPSNSRITGRIKTASVVVPRNASQPNRAKVPFEGVVDAQGNALDGGGDNGTKKDGIAQGTKEDDYTWLFGTSSSMDTTVPTLISVIPGRNGTRVDRNAPIQIRFSKIMDLSSIVKTTVILDKGLHYWFDSDLELDKKQTLVKISHDPLKENTTYSPNVHGTVRDIYQNCFAPCAGPLQ